MIDEATAQAARTASEAVSSNTTLATDALKKLTELAKEGAWVFLLAIGGAVYLLSFGMEIHVWGVGAGTLSTGKFGIALGAGAFVLFLGASLRFYALHEIARVQMRTAETQKAIAEDTLDKTQEGARMAMEHLGRG